MKSGCRQYWPTHKAKHCVVAILFVLFASSLSAADFSHRAHLAQGLECTHCHVSVTKSTRVEDNNLPRPEVCLECHEAAPAIKRPREFPLARFPHARHAGAIPCLGCHKGIDTADVTSNANFPAMAQCVMCHSQVDIPDSCYFCHAKTMNLEPASHDIHWVDAHSRTRRDAAQKASCQTCHGRNFHCAGCH
ncbi:MAG TPA: cytochrome c3 family protein [Bryobacteraceae bacterium]|nr:cytochrome c3 family protein [Bryobacteraceae bacterium]